MSIPEDAEPGAFYGQRQVQQQLSINFSSTIPIKKRRFPIIRPPSPSPQEKIPNYEKEELKRKQESEISDEGKPALIDARNTPSLGNSDVSKTSASIVKKEATQSNIKSGQANVDIFAFTPQEAKPIINLNPVTDLGNTLDIDIVSKEKFSDTEVEGSQSHTVNVKQEILNGQAEGICALELSTDSMSVELSLGPKKLILPPLDCKKDEAICSMSDRSDPSLLSLALSEEKLVWVEKSDSTVGDLGSQASANRSNWNLNTTMDVWERSTDSEEFAHKLADVCGFGKTDSLLRETREFATEISDVQCCHDENSSLTTAGTIGLGLNKGICILDVGKSNSSNSTTIQPSQQCNTDDSLGLRLAMPHGGLDARKEHLSSSENVVSTSASPAPPLLHVHSNVTRGVKSEPVDVNSKRDCSVGSSSSSNMGLLKLSYVKTEYVNNHSLATVLPSTVCPGKLVNYSLSMKSEDGALPQSVVRLTQHKESCASSSSSLLVPQSSCNLTLPICAELTSSVNLSSHLTNTFHGKQLRPCDVGNSSIVDPNKHKLSRVDEGTVEFCQHGEEAKDDDENFNMSAEINEESFESDCGAVDNLMDIGENLRDKEDGEYEDGEVREPIQCSTINESFNVGKKTENFDFAAFDSQTLQPSDLSGDQDIRTSGGKDSTKKNHQETYSDPNKDRISVCSDDSSLLKVSDMVLELGVDEKTIVSVTRLTPDNQLDLLGRKDVKENPQKELSSNRLINVNCGISVQLEDIATCKVVKEICSGDNNLTLSKVEASLKGHDAAKDSSDASNRSRIINLSCGTVVTSPSKTSSIRNGLLTTRSGKERYFDLDGEMQMRGNRDEIYTGSWNKFAKDRVHNQPLRNSGPSFMRGRGRMSNRFGSLRSDWDSDHDFAAETSYCPSDYQPVRRKHASDAEIECNGYDIQHDSNNNRRKSADNEFRRTSLRRFSPSDREGPPNRGNQRLRRFPRNMNPNRSNDDKFIQHLSDDIVNPVYNHLSQTMYDEFDGQEQLVHGNRNFSTMQRKGYPQNHSKSPGRSRIHSPGPWPSSPQRRSPPFYSRTGRMRSRDHACFRDEMVFRRLRSPSDVAGHRNDLGSGREHVHHWRSANPSRRSSPDQDFPKSGKRTDPLDSDGDQYMNKFRKLRGDRSIDERRKFTEVRGPRPVRTFRPGYNSEGENFRFHRNDSPRPSYRFCPDVDKEFVGRGNEREREFDGRVKHQPSDVSRRVRNVEEQEDENYRPVERVWHDDGFVDGRDKRRRF